MQLKREVNLNAFGFTENSLYFPQFFFYYKMDKVKTGYFDSDKAQMIENVIIK